MKSRKGINIMTKFESLQNLLNEKQSVSGIRKQNVRSSLEGLLMYGKTTTGSSSWISKRRGASKDVWTDEVSAVLKRLGIAHECGNDAPRGGANGEYVKITMPAFLKVVKKNEAERKARWAEEEKARQERIAIAEEARKAHHDAMMKKVESLLDKFLAVDYSFIERKQYAHLATKNEQKGFANAIAEQTGIDYQTCLWFVRGEQFANHMKSFISA